MLKALTHTNVWVHDQDEALAFYTEKLGFEVRTDATMEEFGNYRWLTVGHPDQPDVELILSVPGPPATSAEAAEQILALVAQGDASGLIFSTDDCRATYEELKSRGVEVLEPTERLYGIDAAFRDPSGNQHRMTEAPPG